ncbi:MAG: PilZ domain-containing protein [Candidatus Omnitrophota bacterium]|nr:PilZ domain-containing protein [Candidatus Omnitrophota bacterium]
MADQTERRRFLRFPVYCPLQYRCESKKMRDESITLNISEGGALVSTREPIDIGTDIAVRICLSRGVFFITASVRHIRKESEGGPYNVGIEFKEQTPDFTRGFNEEMGALSLYQRQLCDEEDREISLTEASMKWYKDSPAWF